MVYESVSSTPIDRSKPITIGEGMEYSNQYASDFSNDYFRADDVIGVKNLYADGTMPAGYERVGDYVKNIKTGEFVDGLTMDLGRKYWGVFGPKIGSNIYLSMSAFTSPENLFLTMGHEYIHAAFNSIGYEASNYTNKQEAVAYKWSYNQASRWNMNSTSFYKMKMDFFAQYNRGMYPWSLKTIREGFMKPYTKPW